RRLRPITEVGRNRGLLAEAPLVSSSNQASEVSASVGSADRGENASTRLVEILLLANEVPRMHEEERHIEARVEALRLFRRGRGGAAHQGGGIEDVVELESDFLLPVVVALHHADTETDASSRRADIRLEEIVDGPAVLKRGNVFVRSACLVD